MLAGIIFIWLVTAIGLWIANMIVPGIHIKSTSTLFKAALVLGLINAFIRPLLWLLTLPLTVLSFGLFALVVNAFTLWISAAMVRDFEVDSFASAILAAIVMALLGLAGFILMQWLMMGDIHWYYFEQSSHHGNGIFI
ncbi:MAG TPA: phage holin family protein [Gammaproteobacteria bacterium]|nr:phage holin family protein [Gammaproteobacteria bacterium]